MNVYVEYVIIDNFIFDYLLLCLTFKSNGKEPPKSRLIFSAIFGTVFAIVFPFLKFHELILFALKIVCVFAMVAIAYPFESYKDYLKKVLKFNLLTFAFGGMIFGFFSLIGLDYSFLYGTTDSAVPLGILITVAAVLYWAFEKLYYRLFQNKLIYPFICRCVIFSKGRKIQISAFIDSGNQLTDGEGESVCIASSSLARKLFLLGMIGGSPHGEMQISTASGKGEIKIYEIEEMLIYFEGKKNIINKVKIGVAPQTLHLSEQYELIIGAGFILNGRGEL